MNKMKQIETEVKFQEDDPEDRCRECGSRNPTWHAPNELWNLVTGENKYTIICPRCFEDKCDKLNIIVHRI
jgi:hypothetical protein